MTPAVRMRTIRQLSRERAAKAIEALPVVERIGSPRSHGSPLTDVWVDDVGRQLFKVTRIYFGPPRATVEMCGLHYAAYRIKCEGRPRWAMFRLS